MRSTKYLMSCAIVVALSSETSAQTRNFVDEGPIASTERIHGLSFRFKPTSEQAAALERLLQDQQDPSSPLYHAWLSPEEYGDRFGLAPNDVARVSAWLEAEGFQIDAVARSRTWIKFNATAAQLGKAFQTEVHQLRVNGRARYAKVKEPKIPADLEPLLYPLRGLDDPPTESQGQVRRELNLADGAHALGPGDLATIYNVAPLLQNGFNGSGQKIVVAGKSALKLSDIQMFRNSFGLPKNDPKLVLVPGHSDPGMNEEFTEVTADVEIAGAAAPNASIIFVYAANAFDAAEYAVDENMAPVISYSFGGCEKLVGSQTAALAAARSVAQQANAQGITWLVSSGDAGAFACESQRKDYAGSSGIAVNLPASFPEITSVGGTMFADGTGTHWAEGGSKRAPTALSYIPETAWNETASGHLIAASGGGVSVFFAKPAWQTGPGVPNSSGRLVPDISFAAAMDHDPYVIVVDGDFWSWGGTSAATPFFAGAVSVLNQYLVSTGALTKPGLGNINPKLYQLAQTTPGIFHDIVTGNSVIPCQVGTPDCASGRYGYGAGAGWDAVTGLGSLDVNALALKWAGGTSTATASDVTASVEPSPIYQQAPDADGLRWFYTVRLTESAGVATRITGFSIDEGDYSDQIPGLFGSSTLPARGTLSAAMRANVATVPSSHVFTISGVDPTGQRWSRQVTASFLGTQTAGRMSLSSVPETVRQTKGTCASDRPFYQELILQELGGSGVRLTKFSAGTSDFSDQIDSWFGSVRLAPFGVLRATICWQANPLPSTKSYEVEGIDASGQTVKASLQVTFKSAALIPGTLAVSKNSITLSTASGALTSSLNVTLPGDEAWSIAALPANQKSAWLSISSKSGRGPKQIDLTASVNGLPAGVYAATLAVQAENTTPQVINVPVFLVVGSASRTLITGAQNAASYQEVYAPGMLMSVYGTALANSTQSAKSLPLPLALDGVSATVNGVAAPLWFISPGQINLQIPYETPVGSALVVVNNNGQIGFQAIRITATGPGIFANIPAAERGSAVTLYLTGDGEMTPMLDTGAPPAASTPPGQLPKPRATVKVTVGGVPAQVTFVGNPWLVGVTQINFNVPTNAPTGAQPVVVSVGGVPSAPQSLTVR